MGQRLSVAVSGRVRLAGVLLLGLVPIAALLVAANKPVVEEPQIRASVQAAIHEYRAGAAIADPATAKGGMAPAAVASVRSAALRRAQDVATGTALTNLTKNLDAVLAIEQTGTSEVITAHTMDAFIIDVLNATDTTAEAKGREHGFVDFQDPASGKPSRAQSWEYFDASLVKDNGRWLVSSLRVIPTLSDGADGVAPYPAQGDPAE